MTQDSIFEQAVMITKASAYDAILPKYQEMQVTIINLEAERDILKIELKAERQLLQAYKDAFNELKPKDAEVYVLPAVDAEIEQEMKNYDERNDIKDVL